ncbi:MAG TPA: HPr family phosphocarrier protein [candidate division Zixibacteria bacterium]|nr:HPr family phosphocarrier protein [candidate division Zixibacteria bacterium]
MKSANATIVNRLGLHARPSAMLVEEVSRFAAEVWIRRGELKINAKSIMGVMMLAAEQGAELEVITDGPDEEEALAAALRVIASGFGEVDRS